MSSQPFDRKSRKESSGSLSLSTASSAMASSRTLPQPIDSERAVSPSSIDDDEPDWPRSWRAYACMIGCVFLMFNSWGLVNAYGTWSSYYVGHSLRDETQIRLNFIGSTQSGIVLLLSNPVGRLLDAGHFRKVVGCGTVLIPLGLFLLSVVHPTDVEAVTGFWPIWATQGLVVGLGMSTFFVSSSQIASTWFPKRRGLAVGYVACGASIAGVVYPTMLRYLITLVGFNDAVRYVATLTSITCIYSFIFCTPNPAHTHHEPKRWRALETWFDPEAFHTPAFCWFTGAIAFLFLGFYPIFFNLEEWAAVRDFGTRVTGPVSQAATDETSNKPLETFWFLTIMNGCSTVGRMLLAHFSDVIGALNMHIGATVLASILVLFLWSFAASTTDAIAFCVVFGLVSGMVIGLPPASVGNILNGTYTSPENIHLAKKKLGHWTGMMYFFAAVPALCGPLVAGYLIETYNTYLTVQLWSGICFIITFCCMGMARWYLPCENNASAKDELAAFFSKESLAALFKKSKDKRKYSEATLVPPPRTTPPSAAASSEKLDAPRG